MRLVHVTCGALGALLLGAATAAAFPAQPVDGVDLVTPVAMCGYTCGSGGRYVPGPPSVCAEEGLRYCGSSRGGLTRQAIDRQVIFTKAERRERHVPHFCMKRRRLRSQ